MRAILRDMFNIAEKAWTKLAFSRYAPGGSSEVPKSHITRFLPSNPIIVEAGAHNGSDTIEMSKTWPEGTVYAFEPIPEIFDRLVRRTRGLNNVHLFPLALSDKTGTANIFVSSGPSDGSSSLMAPKEHVLVHPDVHFKKTIVIRTITLDVWAKENGIERVDFLWLDMQGYELAMLKASSRILQTVRVIHTEVSLKELYEGVPLYSEVRKWLDERGFRVEREELLWADSGDVLFVRK